MTEKEYCQILYDAEVRRLQQNQGSLLPPGGVVTILAFLLFLLAACKTRTVIEEVPVEVPHYVHDTLKVVQKETETVHVTDSMWIAGDTVFKYRDRWREYVVHDTVYQATRDTIGIPVYITKTETVEVERKPTWWESGVMWLGTITLFFVLAWLIVWLARRFRRR